MSIIDNIRNVADVLRKADNIELYRQILDLQADASKILDENRELKEKLKELETSLQQQEDVEFKNNAYWKKSDGDGPYCVPCWDGKGKLMRMIDDDGYVSCPNSECHYCYQTNECKRREQESVERNRRRGEEYFERL